MAEEELKAEVDYYDIVREKLSLGPLHYPRHEKIFELMKVFWPEEETIKVLALFPPAGQKISLADLSAKAGLPLNEVRKILKKPVAKKTVSKFQNDYGLEPLAPGIFEAYFIARQDTPENLKKAGEIYRWLFIHFDEMDIFDQGTELFRPVLSIDVKEKLIKIDESVDAESYVLPYESVEDIINKNDFFAIAPCQCRYIGELSGEPCQRASSEMGCFIAGKGAQALPNFGWAKALTKEEAIAYLQQTEKAGLVHLTSNSKGGEHLSFTCNCCPCHCGVLKYKIIIPSNFKPIIDAQICAECETCMEKCPMAAISHSDAGKMVIDTKLCIGCGLCATNCPNTAITMQKVSQTIPPKVKLIGNKMFMQMMGELLI